MAKIKHDHAVTQMALSNLDAWVNSPRVLSMIVCMVVYCVMQGVVDQAGFWVAGIELQLTLPEKLFVKLYNSFYNMGSLLFLVMVSEIPRRIPFQHMMLIRSTRRKWITSQCLYCALMVILTILLLCMTYMLVVFPDSPLGNTFTDNEFIAAGYYEQEDSFIPAYIRSQFTPWSACLISAVPMFFFWYTMVLVILLCSMMGHPMLAPSLYGLILLAPTTLLTECLPSWLVLPTDFSSLGAIVAKCVGGELSHFAAVLTGYLAVDTGLIFILYRIALHTDFAFFDQK